MKLDVLIKVVNPVFTGVSRSTGNTYKTQEVVVEWIEPLADGRQRSQLLKVKLFGQSVEKLAALNPVAGQTVVAMDICFQTSSHNGKVYNEVTAWV